MDGPRGSQDGQRILKQVQDEIIKWIAEGKITIPVGNYNEDSPNKGKGKLKEHEQNIKNRKREDDFLKEIERCEPPLISV